MIRRSLPLRRFLETRFGGVTYPLPDRNRMPTQATTPKRHEVSRSSTRRTAMLCLLRVDGQLALLFGRVSHPYWPQAH